MDKTIRIKAMCIFLHEGKMLVAQGLEKKTDKPFYRVLGGSLNPFEKSIDAVRREIQEELHTDIKNIELLEVIENIFEFEGEKGDEIVFLYKADLVNEALYTQETIRIVEEAYELDAKWVPVEDILGGDVPLYPGMEYEKYLNV